MTGSAGPSDQELADNIKKRVSTLPRDAEIVKRYNHVDADVPYATLHQTFFQLCY